MIKHSETFYGRLHIIVRCDTPAIKRTLVNDGIAVTRVGYVTVASDALHGANTIRNKKLTMPCMKRFDKRISKYPNPRAESGRNTGSENLILLKTVPGTVF